jgi:hypothetical protein
MIRTEGILNLDLSTVLFVILTGLHPWSAQSEDKVACPSPQIVRCRYSLDAEIGKECTSLPVPDLNGICGELMAGSRRGRERACSAIERHVERKMKKRSAGSKAERKQKRGKAGPARRAGLGTGWSHMQGWHRRSNHHAACSAMPSCKERKEERRGAEAEPPPPHSHAPATPVPMWPYVRSAAGCLPLARERSPVPVPIPIDEFPTCEGPSHAARPHLSAPATCPSAQRLAFCTSSYRALSNRSDKKRDPPRRGPRLSAKHLQQKKNTWAVPVPTAQQSISALESVSSRGPPNVHSRAVCAEDPVHTLFNCSSFTTCFATWEL